MKRSRVRVLVVFEGDLKNAPTVGIEPETSRSLGGHHIHYTTAILAQNNMDYTAKAEQTYFAIRGGKAKRVYASSAVEAASVCGGTSHFAAKLRICPPRHAAIRYMMPSRCAS
ncbi:hypothetical protein DPMN_019576 [Dreissena polymorpha]|uniref:Uncharacterized protein n=1 Tax=Dreissena polymorpha TaxID=45954 RepID=A0A9D4SAC0_DREPO|nr:hypothetical protein DPMN_019576 [Dreissena polymorpha]